MLYDPNIVMFALALFTIIVTFLAIESKEIVYSLFYFGVFTVLIGLIFFYLGAYYIAVFQIAVYAGAVVALILFAIMLTKRKGEVVVTHSTLTQKVIAASVTAVFFVLSAVVLLPDFPAVTFSGTMPTLTDLISIATTNAVMIIFVGIALATSLFASIFALEGGR